MRLLIAIAVLLSFVTTSEAQRVCPNCGRVHAVQTVANVASNATQRIADAKAHYAARHGIRGHVLKHLGYGSARYEGIAWSSISPQSALDNCCYSGNPGTTGPRKTPIARTVVKGRGGLWYACVLYVD